MSSEFETVRTRILTASTSQPPSRRPSSTPSSTPPQNNPNFITLLTSHILSLSTARISQGFLHLHPSPIHTHPYLPTPLPQYTHLTDLLRRIDINLSTIPAPKLHTFFSTLLSRLIHSSTLLTPHLTDFPTALRICTAVFTSTPITELPPPQPQDAEGINFANILKARTGVYNHSKALAFFITALISPAGELTQDLIKQTHKILVTDNPPLDSKPHDQYGGWYRDYRLTNSPSTSPSKTSRRSSSVYTFNQDFRRQSSISIPPDSRKNSLYTTSISAFSSTTTSPTSPLRSVQYPITPITELDEDEPLFPSLTQNRRESIDPRAVSIYMSKLITTYHAQLAMDRSPTDPKISEILRAEEREEGTVSDPFALSAWLVTEFLHIHPFITANEEMGRIILSGVLMKELGIVAVLGSDPEEYSGILERCEERHGGEGMQGRGESYAEFAALVVRKAVECVEEIAAMVGRS
ncbi:hypothetical protein TWF481_000166 [Arthrobotrys musiformis]|uniref:Fido domain-containing protein n=1 Tax=Arthrobotrys musiformis TaxID=47236 RepID=A0AAV9WLT2_9PEZI